LAVFSDSALCVLSAVSQKCEQIKYLSRSSFYF